MEIVIHILILFILLNTVVKLSFWRWWQAALFGMLCGAFVVAACPHAVMQSKTQLADYLANQALLQDAAVLVTLESSVCFAYCFLALGRWISGWKTRWYRVLHLYAGLLVFPVLYYLLVQCIFTFPGTSFSAIAWSLAGTVAVVLPLIAILTAKQLPEKQFRLEIHFLLSLFICMLGLISTVNGHVVYTAAQPTQRTVVWLALGLFAVLFLAGLVFNRLKFIIYQRKTEKQRSS